MFQRFLRDSIVYAMANIIARGMPFFILPIYAMVLHPEDFGILDLGLMFIVLAKFVVALEMTQAVARFYPDAESITDKARYASTALWFSAMMYTLFLIITFPVARELATVLFGSTGQDFVLHIVLCTVWSEGIFYLLQNQLRYQLATKAYNIVTIFHAILSTMLAVCFIFFMGTGLIGVFYGMLLSGLLNMGLAYYYAREQYIFVIDWHKCRQMLIFSIPLIPSSLAVFSSLYIDRLFINYFSGLDAVGIYGVAYRFAMMMGLPLAGIQVALSPLIYTHYQQKDTPQTVALIFRTFLLLVLPLLLVISFFSKDFILLFSNETFLPAASIIPWLGAAILFGNMYIFAPGLFLAHKTGTIMTINILSGVINIVLNIILIPFMGIAGAALATLASAVLSFLLHLIIGQSHYHIPHHWRLIVVASVLTIVCVWIGGTMSMIFKGMISIMIWPVIAVILFTRNEISHAIRQCKMFFASI